MFLHTCQPFLENSFVKLKSLDFSVRLRKHKCDEIASVLPCTAATNNFLSLLADEQTWLKL